MLIPADLLAVENGIAVPELRRLATRHSIGFSGVKSVSRAQEVVKNHLKDAIDRISEGSYNCYNENAMSEPARLMCVVRRRSSKQE